MSDLILQTRVGLLKKNLERVRDATKDIADGRDQLGKIQSGADQALDAVDLVQDAVTDAVRAHDRAREEALDDSLARLDALTDELTKSLRALKKDADAIGSRWVDFSGGLKMLADETVEELKAVETLEASLAAASAAGAKGDALGAAWTEYSTNLFRHGQQIFGEYVDFLGGVALREGGFVNQNVYKLADELIRQSAKLFRIDWTSLSIPARREALGRTTARIIRLGFPEWTIWALPLTAHELGHVLVGDARPLEEAMKAAAAADERHAPILVADAFAACTMGPAYAAAATLMRLDPWRAFSEEEGCLVAKRAEATLGTAERMSEATDEYRKVVEQLRAEWTDALRQSGQPTELSEHDQAGVRAAIEGVTRVMALPTYDRGQEVWSVVVEWSEALLTGSLDNAPIGLEGELRDLLNAAWIARLTAARDGQPSGAIVDDIAQNAMTLWDEVERVRRSGGRAGAASGSAAAERRSGGDRAIAATERERSPR